MHKKNNKRWKKITSAYIFSGGFSLIAVVVLQIMAIGIDTASSFTPFAIVGAPIFCLGLGIILYALFNKHTFFIKVVPFTPYETVKAIDNILKQKNIPYRKEHKKHTMHFIFGENLRIIVSKTDPQCEDKVDFTTNSAFAFTTIRIKALDGVDPLVESLKNKIDEGFQPKAL